ncbi:hypothetical protein RB195_002926 [Necator americanus]|uniref:Uncharacterized protein n=1 Tax=Necator americanus TaxID=51031 RepID=A0ABR1DLB8_NECAM
MMPSQRDYTPQMGLASQHEAVEGTASISEQLRLRVVVFFITTWPGDNVLTTSHTEESSEKKLSVAHKFDIAHSIVLLDGKRFKQQRLLPEGGKDGSVEAFHPVAHCHQ